jgi:hypothetical protein
MIHGREEPSSYGEKGYVQHANAEEASFHLCIVNKEEMET